MEPHELTQNYVRKAYVDIKSRAEEEVAKNAIGPSSAAIHSSNALSVAHKFPSVLAQLRQIVPLSLILDIGCGDNLHVRNDCFTIGMDVNGPRAAQTRHFDFVLADATCPPFRKGLFDAVLLVSVLHHIPSEEMRIKCLRNCLWLASEQKSRIVTVVWAKEQKAAKFPGHTVEIPFNRDTTREQRIMKNAVPIRVKVPLNDQCPNYVPKNVRQRVLEVVSRVGWLYPMISIEFYEQRLHYIANFIIDRLAELRRFRDRSLKNGPSLADPHLPIFAFALKLSASAVDDAFVHLRVIYRDVLKYRYYHLFGANELEHLLTKVRAVDRNLAEFQTKSVEYEMGNWCSTIGKSGEEQGKREGNRS